VAILEDRHLVEVQYDRPDQGRLVGDIFLGQVEAVLPGIQAAFVDIGTDKAGFLHASDLDYEEEDEENGGENGGGRKKSRRNTPIQDVIRQGEEVLVQVTKEPIGTKGPRLTTQISLPGRFLVFMPSSSHVGVSRKIEERGERARLRKLAREIVPRDNGGVIVRTVGEELNRNTFQKEFKRLLESWEEIQGKADQVRAPALVHGEAKLISGVIRDLFSDKFDALIVDDRQIHEEIARYLRKVEPELLDRLHLYEEPLPLFDKYGVEEEIHQAFRKKVNLDSGGHIVIEPTEALVSIDVNTGRYTGKKRKDPEHTILKTNLDAAREIAKQLRLRDVGGIIVCDFIDMESQKNRDRVLHELRSHLGRDRARTKAFEVSDLGLVEMTRQRVRPPLFQSLTETCGHCGGAGRVFSPATVVRQVERSLNRVAALGREKQVTVRLHPEVALQILEQERGFLPEARRRTKMKVDLRDDPLMRQDEYRILAGPAEEDVTEKYVTG
jgi:ribonuclease G